jgi:hypothetical protein
LPVGRVAYGESQRFGGTPAVSSLDLPPCGAFSFGKALFLFLAYRLGGFLSAGLSLFFPIAVQIWVLEIWDRTSAFWSQFALMCSIYFLLWVLICAKRIHGGKRGS